MAQKKFAKLFSFKMKSSEKQKCVNNLFLSKSKILKRLNHRISENLQNCNQQIRNFQFWYYFCGKIVFQWFLGFRLISVHLILQNILRRKELENLNNFSLKIRPELKIFCDSIFLKFQISIEIIYVHIFAFLNFFLREKNKVRGIGKSVNAL